MTTYDEARAYLRANGIDPDKDAVAITPAIADALSRDPATPAKPPKCCPACGSDWTEFGAVKQCGTVGAMWSGKFDADGEWEDDGDGADVCYDVCDVDEFSCYNCGRVFAYDEIVAPDPGPQVEPDAEEGDHMQQIEDAEPEGYATIRRQADRA